MNKVTEYKVFCRSAYKVDKLKRYKKIPTEYTKFVPFWRIMLSKLPRRESEAISNSVDNNHSLSVRCFLKYPLSMYQKQKLSKIFLRRRICQYSRIATTEILDLSCPWSVARNCYFSRGKGEPNNSLANKYSSLL